MNRMKYEYGICNICKKEIDDHGTLFCSKCREKDWEIRFKVIKKLDERKSAKWKSGTGTMLSQSIKKSYNADYWNRRREER